MKSGQLIISCCPFACSAAADAHPRAHACAVKHLSVHTYTHTHTHIHNKVLLPTARCTFVTIASQINVLPAVFLLYFTFSLFSFSLRFPLLHYFLPQVVIQFRRLFFFSLFFLFSFFSSSYYLYSFSSASSSHSSFSSSSFTPFND